MTSSLWSLLSRPGVSGCRCLRRPLGLHSAISVGDPGSKGRGLSRRLPTLLGYAYSAGGKASLGKILSPYASPGDHIVALKGASVPYVIREAGKGEYRLIGECIGSKYLGVEQEEGSVCEGGGREILIV